MSGKVLIRLSFILSVIIGFMFVNYLDVYADTASAWLDESDLDAADRSSDDKTVNMNVTSTNWGFCSTSIKSNGKLYTQFGMIQFSPTSGAYSSGYIYYEIRKNSYTGELLLSGQVNRSNVISNNLNFGIGYEYTLTTKSGNVYMVKPFKFYSSTVNCNGAAPNTPSGNVTHISGKRYKVDVSASANKTDTIWFALTYNDKIFEDNNDGVTRGVYDTVTEYKYVVNTSSTAPSATYINANGSSSTSGKFFHTVDNENTQYYVHIVAKSYTGLLSGVKTLSLNPSVYKITLDGNGGSIADDISDNTITNAFYVKYGRWIGYQKTSSYTYYRTRSDGTTFMPYYATRYGYIFNGFYTSKTGGVCILKDKYVQVSNTYFNADTTIYARWTPWSHSVYYDANGGSGAPDSQVKTYDEDMYISDVIPVKEGYTFKYWSGTNGLDYNPGDKYEYEQNQGIVVLKAIWADETKPECYLDASPNEWSAENGLVVVDVSDSGSGLDNVVLRRYSHITDEWSEILSLDADDLDFYIHEEYVEEDEGIYTYELSVKDKEGNEELLTSETIYLDHTKPQLIGLENTELNWTNIAPVMDINANDYLTGTEHTGAGIKSVVMTSSHGKEIYGLNDAISYILKDEDEGMHEWVITVEDNVGNTTVVSITTKYDVTAPCITSAGNTYVILETGKEAEYLTDNIINQYIDDFSIRSDNMPNETSGLSSVIIYKYSNNIGTVMYGDTLKKIFDEPDTLSNFNLYYEVPLSERHVEYYMLIVKDFAGNITKKYFVSQRSTLARIRTCIDRSSY